MSEAFLSTDLRRKTSRRVRVIATFVAVASVIYAVAATFLLPGAGEIGTAIDVFLCGTVPGLVVVLLLSGSRPALYGPRYRRLLVAVTLLAAAAMSVLPFLLRRGGL